MVLDQTPVPTTPVALAEFGAGAAFVVPASLALLNVKGAALKLSFCGICVLSK